MKLGVRRDERGVKIAFPIPGGRWHGAAMTDEGGHGGACAIGGRTQRSAPTPGYDGSCRGRPLRRPVPVKKDLPGKQAGLALHQRRKHA